MKKNRLLPLVILGLCWTGCSKSAMTPQPIDASPAGLLARYNLGVSDYDVLPVTTFVLSYDSANQASEVFEKSGQTLISYSLSYTGGKLAHSSNNSLGAQSYLYDNGGRISQINYTTLLDTGKRVFTYDGSGKLISVLDSVTNPPSFPIRYQYVYGYDSTGNNVAEVTINSLDIAGRPTLRQINFYTFDNQVNPFSGFPPLLDVRQLPGDLPAIINKNNVVNTYIAGTVLQTAGGGSVATLDTIGTWSSVRKYQYNAKGYPITCTEAFQDIQYNYSGSRNFSYDY